MLQESLHHKNPFVRKAAMQTLAVAKRLRRGAGAEELAHNPPTVANSFPKSGTHLLDQLVGALPARVNYGEFLSSMTSSLRFRRRPDAGSARRLARSLPGEVVRAHLFYGEETARALRGVNAVHYFIYRDPRDVVVSEAHYLRGMNRWHRLHKVFKETASVEDAIRLSITGLGEDHPHYFYPDIAQRFKLYATWLSDADCCAVRFEDLVGPGAAGVVLDMAHHYAERSRQSVDANELADAMRAAVAPEKSHTYRSGKRGGWRDAFTPELRRLFVDTAGPLLIELGYEPDDQWAGRDNQPPSQVNDK